MRYDTKPPQNTATFGVASRKQAERRRMHATGDYTLADLAEVFNVSRPTVYRTLERDLPIS